jgi:hypothetical protein
VKARFVLLAVVLGTVLSLAFVLADGIWPGVR